jgi:hypothetical protein
MDSGGGYRYDRFVGGLMWLLGASVLWQLAGDIHATQTWLLHPDRQLIISAW